MSATAVRNFINVLKLLFIVWSLFYMVMPLAFHSQHLWDHPFDNRSVNNDLWIQLCFAYVYTFAMYGILAVI
jgi:hypothetical protein